MDESGTKKKKQFSYTQMPAAPNVLYPIVRKEDTEDSIWTRTCFKCSG